MDSTAISLVRTISSLSLRLTLNKTGNIARVVREIRTIVGLGWPVLSGRCPEFNTKKAVQGLLAELKKVRTGRAQVEVCSIVR